jgi:N6-adenosine-specific RNA methylase IME4
MPPLPDGPFDLIYADPGWRWQPWSWATGAGRSAERHYRTDPLESIKALPIPAAKDCALALWSISAMLPQALELMAAWGFQYRTQAVWVKPSIGLGYWWRQQHELLLLGIRGRMRAPPPGARLPSVIYAPRRQHSEKPDAVAHMLEVMFPAARKLELFARKRRPGWTSWGDELEHSGEPQTVLEIPAADAVPLSPPGA